MRISELFTLNATQFELDFVDIDPHQDTPLFLDPYVLQYSTSSWGTDAYRTLLNFFQTFVELIRAGDRAAARDLFNYLHEPNETCLGLSSGRPRGNAIGEVDGAKLFDSIIESQAVQEGLVESLEDFRLFVPGIDKDKISDMTTNIVRKHLIKYTQQQCDLWSIRTQDGVQSGYFWSAAERRWENEYTRMLLIDDNRILLTPKAIVSYAEKYTPRKYYQKFILQFLKNEHLAARSHLVQHRKNGTPYVTKKSIEEETPYSKDFVSNFTRNHPDVFRDFKTWVGAQATPIRSEDIVPDDPATIAQYLTERLRNMPRGNDNATAYHRLVVGILELLFYPSATNPIVEREIHEGRKRIDITFDNAARAGFFYRLHTTYHHPAQFIFVECKNYTKDVANPELDQLAGRFSVNRGKVGFLVCRGVDDMQTLLMRCHDAYVDQRGIMLPLTDDDLIAMLARVEGGLRLPFEELLMERFRGVAL